MEHSKKTVEAFEVTPSETVEIIEAKISKKTVGELEGKSSKKTAKVIEVKPSNKNVAVLETLQQVSSYTRDGNKSDVECPISISREGEKDHSNDNENDMETVEDLFKKYVPEEYLDFLDSSLPIDTCCEFYNNINDEKDVGPVEPLSKSVPLNMSEKPQSELNNTEETQNSFPCSSSPVDVNIGHMKDLVDTKETFTNEQAASCPPLSAVQTSSVTTEKARTLPRNDLNGDTEEQPKRYSLRQRKKKGFKIYDDTDEWCDQLDFNVEHTDNLKDHQQTYHNFGENENKYGQCKNHNGQSVIQQRYNPTDGAEESMEYNYKPRKRKSAQSHYCMACHMGFKSKGDLQMHKALNGCDDLYQCVVCCDFFSSIENLCIHGSIHNVFFCPICGRCYKTKPGLYRHQLDHTGSKPYSCEKCHSTYKTRNELVIHDRYHTGDMPFHCHQCWKGFPTQGQFKRHINMHATDDTVMDLETSFESLQCHECKKCSNIFNSEELLRSHERVHDDTLEASDGASVDNSQNCSNKLEFDKLNIKNCEDFQPKADFVHQSLEREDDSQSQIFDLTQSEECGGDFQLKKCGVHRLEEHEDTFQSQSNVDQSKEYGDKFQVSGEIQRNEPVENVDSDKPFYKCTQCSKILKSHMAYLYHRLIHKRDALEKSYKCDKCPMIFHLESSLASHQLIHREPRPTMCDTCGKTFSNQLDLVYHRAVHDAEKGSFKCSKCPKVFQLVKQLARHTETHLKDRRQFPCEICDKIFKTRSGLARHNMDHTGERRYSCSMCTKKFKTSTQLRCHVAVHTGIRPYSCKICGKSFPIKSYLTSHFTTHK
ncbi:zinc finger protein 665-like [Mizuhopecten yessoensis]|uniref:zinc finger protein 665-like n=1 Tax=Mizuhopecten yessoensis TaxID=6573 RepID=UPI000B457DAB|nr:zinc finger protein 665-like [Mizuhopecten yessoensis]